MTVTGPISFQQPLEIETPKTSISSGSSQGYNGMSLFFLEGRFPCFEEKSKDNTRKFKATVINPIHLQQTENLDMKGIISSGRVICLIFQNGIIQKMTVHPTWYDKIVEEKALDLAMKVESKYEFPVGNFSLIKMTEESYANMITKMGLSQYR